MAKPDSKKDLSGTRLSSYLIKRKIGKGGMGEVYEAYEESLDRIVALKVLPSYLAEDESFTERFLREAKHAAKLEHPAIASIYSAGESNGIYYIAMQFIHGKTLAEVINTRGALRQTQALLVTRAVAEALSFAHSRGIIHRDIKPENIMIDLDGKVKVMDFGLARETRAKTKVTQTGVYVGTPEYSSPEQCETDEIDSRTDIYSLGVVLYEMLTGRVPHTAETPLALFRKICTEEPLPVRKLNSQVSEQVEAIVNKMIAKNRDERFATADDVISAIDEIIRDENIDLGESVQVAIGGAEDSTKIGSWKRTTKPQKSRNHLAIAVGAALAILVAVLIFVLTRKPAPIEEEISNVSQQENVSNPATHPPKVVEPPTVPKEDTSSPTTLLVFDFVNRKNDPDIEWMEMGIADMFIRDLAQHKFLRLVSREQLRKTLRKLAINMKQAESDPTLIVAELKPELLLKGAVIKEGGSIWIDIELLNASSGTLLHTAKEFEKEENFLSAIDRLTSNLRGKLVSLIKESKPSVDDSIFASGSDLSLHEQVFLAAAVEKFSEPEEGKGTSQRAFSKKDAFTPATAGKLEGEKLAQNANKSQKTLEESEVERVEESSKKKRDKADEKGGAVKEEIHKDENGFGSGGGGKQGATGSPREIDREEAESPGVPLSEEESGTAQAGKSEKPEKSPIENKKRQDEEKRDRLQRQGQKKLAVGEELEKEVVELSQAQKDYFAMKLYFEALRTFEGSDESKESLESALRILDEALSISPNFKLALDKKVELERALGALTK